MSRVLRRVIQGAIALALAGLTILVTAWAYPAGHVTIQVGRPYYSRAAGEDAAFVTIDITVRNVGADPVRIDREHFLLVDETGHRYRSDPSTHLLRDHFDLLTIPAGHEIRGTTVFKISPQHRAAGMLFVTSTGQTVWFRLSS